MFAGNKSLNNINGLSRWNVSNGRSFSAMFGRYSFLNDDRNPSCVSLQNVNALSNWDVHNGTNFSYMFQGDTSLTNLSGLNNWNVSNGKTFEGMFQGDTGLTNLNSLTNWRPTSGIYFKNMFEGDAGLTSLNGLTNWRPNSGINFNGMFQDDTGLTSLNGLNSWNLASGADLTSMFQGDTSLNDLRALSTWDVSKGKIFTNMFNGDSLKDDYLQGIGNWDMANATNIQGMFANNKLFDPTALKNWKVSDTANFLASGVNSGIFYNNATGEVDWKLGGAKETINFKYPSSYTGTEGTQKVQKLKYSISSNSGSFDTRTSFDIVSEVDGKRNVYDLGERLPWTDRGIDRYHYFISRAMDLEMGPDPTVSGDKDADDTSMFGAFAAVDIPQVTGYVAVAKDADGNIISNADGTKVKALKVKTPVTVTGDAPYEYLFDGGSPIITVFYYAAGIGSDGSHSYSGHPYYVKGNNISLHVNEQAPTADQVVNLTDGEGNTITGTINGWTNVDTSQVGDTTENLTINYGTGIPTGSLTLTVHVIGGDEKKTVSGSTTTYPTTVDNGGTLTPAQAKAAIANAENNTAPAGSVSNDLTQFGTNTYSWAKNANGTGTVDTTYDANDTAHNTKLRKAYVIITYSDSTTQAVQVHYNVNSDADSFNGTITNATGQKIMAHANEAIGNVVPGFSKISVKDGDNNPMAENTNTTGALNGWKFAGWVKNDATHSASDVSLDDRNLDNEGKKTAQAYAKIELKDGSYVYSSSPITINVLGGYENKTVSGSTTTYPVTVDNGTNLNAGDAATAIANSSDLTQFGTRRNPVSYAWSTDGVHTGTGYNPDVTYREGATGLEGTKLRTAYVIITYGDGTTQAVQVHYNVNSDADAAFPAGSTVTSSDISAHVVNTGTTDGSDLIGDDIQVTITNRGTSTTKTITDLGHGASIAWKTTDGPDLLTADTTGTDRTATITFADGSTKDITIKVKVLAATAKTTAPAVDSMQTPGAASGYVDLPTGFSVATPATDIKWVAASDDSGKYTVTSTTPSYNTTWSSSHTTEQAYVEIDYADGKGSQIVPVTLNLTSSHDGINAALATGASIATHINAAVTDWTDSTGTTTATAGNAKDYVNLTYGTGSSATAVDLSNLGASTSPIKSITWVIKPDTSAVADAAANKKATIKITFTDGSAAKTVEVPYTVVGGTSVADSAAATLDRGEDLTTDAAKTVTKGLIANNRDLDTYNATYAWSTTDGPDVTASSNGTVKHAKLIISYFKDAAHTQADGTQTVTVPYKVQDDTETHAPTVNSDGLTVHYGQAVTTDDAIGLIKISSSTAYLTPSEVGTGHTVTGVQWVTSSTNDTVITPDTLQATVGQGNTDVPSYIKVTYADGSSKIVAAGIHVHAGYNDTDQSYTLVSGTKPTDDDAKAAIKNSAAGAVDSLSGYNVSYKWAMDSTGTALTDAYVTSSTNVNKDAWVVITYTDGVGARAHTATQIVKVNQLYIKSQANSYTISEVTGGLNSHAVDSGSPDIGHLKNYFTVLGGTSGTTDESSKVTSAAWKSGTGNEPNWTTAGDKTGTVTLTFADGSTKDVTLDVHLVGADVPDTTESTYRNVAPTSAQAKGKVTNAARDLDQYHTTYGWYSAAAATTALTDSDVASATAAGHPKKVYLAVKYYKDAAHTEADGQQVIKMDLTINNSSSMYTASLNDTSTTIRTHVNAPSTDFANWSDWITVKKTSDSSTIDLSTVGTASNPIRSIEWQTAPNTALAADSSQTSHS